MPHLELIDKHVLPLLRAEYVPGIAAGVYQDGVRRLRGFGVVSPQSGRAPDERTLYETGSVGKLFTALLLSEADRRGEVSLGQRLDQVKGLTEPVAQIDGHPILLWHLAAHLSGLPREPDDLGDAEPNPYAGYTEAKMWSFLARAQPSQPPGSSYEYSNLGTGLLGVALERATGLSYAEQIRHRLTAPLGLPDTVVEPSAEQLARLAEPTAFGWPTESWASDDALAAAGCLRSTLWDTLRFAELHLCPPDGPLGESMRRAAELRFPFPEGGGVALGWHVTADGTRWHNGSTGGYHAYVAFSRQHGFALALLANDICPEVSQAGHLLVKALSGQCVQPLELPEPLPFPVSHLDRLTGRYVDPGIGSGMLVRRQGHRLVARLDGQVALPIFPESETSFAYRAVEARIRFDLPRQGKAAALTVLQQGGEWILARCRQRRSEGTASHHRGRPT